MALKNNDILFTLKYMSEKYENMPPLADEIKELSILIYTMMCLIDFGEIELENMKRGGRR